MDLNWGVGPPSEESHTPSSDAGQSSNDHSAGLRQSHSRDAPKPQVRGNSLARQKSAEQGDRSTSHRGRRFHDQSPESSRSRSRDGTKPTEIKANTSTKKRRTSSPSTSHTAPATQAPTSSKESAQSSQPHSRVEIRSTTEHEALDIHWSGAASPLESHTPSSMEGQSSYDHSAESSQPQSRDGKRPQRRKKNVQFTSGGETLDAENHRAAFNIRDETSSPPRPKPAARRRSDSQSTRIFSPASIGSRRSPQRISERTNEDAENPADQNTTASFSKARPSVSRPATTERPLTDKTNQEGTGYAKAPAPRSKTSIMRQHSRDVDADAAVEDENKSEGQKAAHDSGEDTDDGAVGKAFSQQVAEDKAQRLSRMIGSHSAPGSRYSSPMGHRRKISGNSTKQLSPPSTAPPSPPPDGEGGMPLNLNDLPLEKLNTRRTKFGIEDESDEEDENHDEEKIKAKEKDKSKNPGRLYRSAVRLVAHHTGKGRTGVKPTPKLFRTNSSDLPSGVQTPINERDPNYYVPRPKEYREGYLSSILKLYNEQGAGSTLANISKGPGAVNRAAHQRDYKHDPLLASGATTQAPSTPGVTPGTTPGPSPITSPSPSATSTPRLKHQKWYYKNPQQSQSTGALSDLVSSSTVLAQPGGSKQASAISKDPSAVRPKPKHRPLSTQAADAIGSVVGKKRKKNDDHIRIQVHIAETMQRQKYLMKVCRSLMLYGAPTHRLEEYMRMSARVLEIDGQFLYMPGCMIISFDDRNTHTTDVKIVRTAQAVDLGKLRDTHEVYKEVVHDLIGVEEANQRLAEIESRRDRYNRWFRVLVYGLAALSVGPFAFGARPIDLPIAFFLGCLLGILQLIVAPRSELYANIFEVTAAVLTSFLARAFGSIGGGKYFCFSALAQSAIALILPGYTVLCASLELQSRNIIAGSVRMVYAVIYSLFLGFGITVGTAFYGGIDPHATSATTCESHPYVQTWYYKFAFVPLFTFCLIVINQGKWKQMPWMIGIAMIGYIVNYFSARRFASNAQIANTLGALAVGVLGNLYSRLRHGLAAAALLPAIFVQVPSGLAAGGSLVSGITSANQITDPGAANGTTTVSDPSASGIDVNSMVFNVAYSMIQVAIGITVGLFLSALIVYPFGKRRSGLFSF